MAATHPPVPSPALLRRVQRDRRIRRERPAEPATAPGAARPRRKRALVRFVDMTRRAPLPRP